MGYIKIDCKDCNKIYTGETKFKLQKRLKTHMKDVQYGRENRAVIKHTTEYSHKIDWEGAMCLECGTRTLPRKIIEGCHIKGNERKCMNLNEGLVVSAQYKGKGHGYERGDKEKGNRTSLEAWKTPEIDNFIS